MTSSVPPTEVTYGEQAGKSLREETGNRKQRTKALSIELSQAQNKRRRGLHEAIRGRRQGRARGRKQNATSRRKEQRGRTGAGRGTGSRGRCGRWRQSHPRRPGRCKKARMSATEKQTRCQNSEGPAARSGAASHEAKPHHTGRTAHGARGFTREKTEALKRENKAQSGQGTGHKDGIHTMMETPRTPAFWNSVFTRAAYCARVCVCTRMKQEKANEKKLPIEA